MKILVATVLAAVIAGPALAMDVEKNHKKTHVIRSHKPPIHADSVGAQDNKHDRGDKGDGGTVGASGRGDTGSGGGKAGGGGGGGGGGGKDK
jgi:hypothetical protein